jgi:hypothetical protein
MLSHEILSSARGDMMFGEERGRQDLASNYWFKRIRQLDRGDKKKIIQKLGVLDNQT